MAGDNLYRSNARVLKKDSSIVVQYANIYFTVINEKGVDEEAYIVVMGESDLYV